MGFCVKKYSFCYLWLILRLSFINFNFEKVIRKGIYRWCPLSVIKSGKCTFEENDVVMLQCFMKTRTIISDKVSFSILFVNDLTPGCNYKILVSHLKIPFHWNFHQFELIGLESIKDLYVKSQLFKRYLHLGKEFLY